MKKLWIGIIAIAAMAVVSQASTIVQFGARGGDTNMVTASGTGPDTTGDYAAGNHYNPPGTFGYTGMIFAGAVFKQQNNNWVDNAAGDYIQLLANVSANPTMFYDCMLAWDGGANSSGQSAFLTGDRDLESFHIEFKGRGASNSPEVSFLLQTTAGWYASDQTVSVTGNTYTDFDVNVASLTWTGYSQFGVTAGAGTAPDTSDIVSVGFYMTDTATGGNFSGGMFRNFEVTAIPEPATLGLVASMAGGILFIRRRLML